MSDEYHDTRITCTADPIAVHGYYIPWGTKHIRYDSIRSIQRPPPALATDISAKYGETGEHNRHLLSIVRLATPVRARVVSIRPTPRG